jgi:O-acetyl-ADP-ribose deacetylase (regulator of RNase III)
MKIDLNLKHHTSYPPFHKMSDKKTTSAPKKAAPKGSVAKATTKKTVSKTAAKPAPTPAAAPAIDEENILEANPEGTKIEEKSPIQQATLVPATVPVEIKTTTVPLPPMDPLEGSDLDEPAKAEPPKAEPPKAEPAKAEPAKAEPAKAEPAKDEPAKAEPPTPAPAPKEPSTPAPAPAPAPKEPHVPASTPAPTPGKTPAPGKAPAKNPNAAPAKPAPKPAPKPVPKLEPKVEQKVATENPSSESDPLENGDDDSEDEHKSEVMSQEAIKKTTTKPVVKDGAPAKVATKLTKATKPPPAVDLTKVAPPLPPPTVVEEKLEPKEITENLTIYLRDPDQEVVNSWETVFHDPRVAELAASQGYAITIDMKVGDILDFPDGEVDAVVSASNSFGSMNSGIDNQYIQAFGANLEKDVIDQISKKHNGVLPPGRAMITLLSKYTKKFRFLINAPICIMPASNISDTLNPYLAMKAILEIISTYNQSAKGKKITSFACPGLGPGIGQVPPFRSALQMRAALDGFFKKAFNGKPIKDQRDHYALLATIKKPFKIETLYKP